MWDLLGFKKNVLFNTPILIEENAPSLCCGRKLELTELIYEILSDDKCVKIISGHTGVGKTSFLNTLQYLFYTKSNFFNDLNIYKRLLPCFNPIEITNSDSVESLLEKIIKSISKNIKEYYANSKHSIPREIKEITNYWIGLKDEEISNEKGFELDTTILKFSSKTTVAEIFINKQDPNYAIKTLISLIKEYANFDGIFLQYENLENVEDLKLINLLNEIRD